MTAVPLSTSTKPQNFAGLKWAAAGEAFAAGSVVRLSSGALVQSANDTQANSQVDGIALSTAVAAGQPIWYAPPGAKLTTSGLTKGVAYYLDVAGDLCPFADLSTGEWITLVGIAESATVLRLFLQPLNVQA